MQLVRALGLALLFAAGVAGAANVHNVTWVRKAVAPGTEVTLGGQTFVLVRLPMKEFTNNNRYVVEYLVPEFLPSPPIVASTQLSTVHSDIQLTDTVDVSGYPANISVVDGRSYDYNANLGFDDGLKVEASVVGTVTIKVGDTVLSLSAFFTAEQQALTAVPSPFAASSWATWQYPDPTTLVASFDNWVDFVRVLRVN